MVSSRWLRDAYERDPAAVPVLDWGDESGKAKSKYDKLWEYVEKQEGDELVLTFDEIGTIAGVPLDHSFLNYKKELVPHGWEVGKISMKQQTVRFKRLAE